MAGDKRGRRRRRAGGLVSLYVAALWVLPPSPTAAASAAAIAVSPTRAAAAQEPVAVSVSYRAMVATVATIGIAIPASWLQAGMPQVSSPSRPGYVSLGRGGCTSGTRILGVVRRSDGGATVRIASSCPAGASWTASVRRLRAPATIGLSSWTVTSTSSGTTTTIGRPPVLIVEPWPTVPPAPANLPACFSTGSPAVSYGCWVTTVAGNGPPTLGDGGPATRAVLDEPWSVAFGTDGTTYVVDRADDRIRAISPSGVIRTVVGTGSAEMQGLGDGGPATAASLRFPRDVVLTPDGGMLIADGNHYVVRRVDAGGTITTIAGNRGASTFTGLDGPAVDASLKANPASVDYDRAGNIYIALGSGVNRVVRVDPAGTLQPVAGTGEARNTGDGGLASAAAIDAPEWLRVDRSRNLLYVLSNPVGGPLLLRRVDLSTGRIATLPIGALGASTFALDSRGHPVVMTAGGRLETVDGQTGAVLSTIPVASNLHGSPVGINDRGQVVLALADRIILVSPSGAASLIAGSGTLMPVRATASSTTLFDSQGLAFDAHGDLYVGDFDHNLIRRIAPDGMITNVAGAGQWGSSGNGGPPLSATFAQPRSFVFDRLGRLFFIDEVYGTGVVRMIAPGADGVIDGSAEERIIAVAGQALDRSHADHGAADGSPATAAVFNAARGLCVDPADNLYVADPYDNRVRKIVPGPDGILNGGPGEIITTVAGDGSAIESGDGGPAVAAGTPAVQDLYCAPNGDVYVRDGTVSESIRRIDAGTGVISTVVSGLSNVMFFTLDPVGNLYWTVDDQNGRSQLFRRDAGTGATAVVAGVGPSGFSGDGGSAPGAAFFSLSFFTLGPDGALYIVDNGSFRLRRVAFLVLPAS